ncbi:MAG: ATP-binding protein [Spirochaetota bacterium]
MPDNSVQTKPYCQFCDFTGVIRNDAASVTGEHFLTPCPRCSQPNCLCGGKLPYYYPTPEGVKECPCRRVHLKIDRINDLYTRCGIDKKYRWRFINEFKEVNKNAQTAKNLAYDIITKFPDIDKGLFLWGNPGTGKTLLSSIILTELITRYAVEGKFMKISRNFFGKLKATFVEGSANYGMASRIEEEMANVDILIVDDFGTQRDTPWELETLYNLVDARYEKEKFTIFTANADPNVSMRDLYEGRILSRVRSMCRIVDLSGVDQRNGEQEK